MVALFFVSAPLIGHAQPAETSIYPSADAFVRQMAPESNYGGAGALSVSGSAALNGMSVSQGPSDSFMRFPMSDFATAMDTQYGTGAWSVVSVSLTTTENGTPNNPVFNRGVGTFEIQWIAANNWIEGTGSPMLPTDNGVVYNDEPSLLNPAVDVSVGVFTNSGMNEELSFALTLAAPMVSNIVHGADVDLFLTAVSTNVGFTFNSRNYILSNAWPTLDITVEPAVPVISPQISSITLTGATQVLIQFNTASNWTYVVQGTTSAAGGGWTGLSTNAAQSHDSTAAFLDSATNAQRYYRLRAFKP